MPKGPRGEKRPADAIGAAVKVAAGIADRVFDWEDLLARVDAAQAPKKRGPYKKRGALAGAG